MEENKYEFVQENPSQQLNVVDVTPTLKESLVGILLGAGYLTVLTIVPLIILLMFFGNPTTSAGSAIMSVWAQILTAVGILIAMGFVSRRLMKQFIKGFTWRAVLDGLLWALLVYAVAIGVNMLDMIMFGAAADTNANQSSIEDLMLAAPLLGVFFTCIIGPVVEEVIFRYYVFKTISKKSIVWAFIITSISFGAIHLISSISNLVADGNWTLFFNDLRSLAGYVSGGVMFCVIYHKFKKLSVSILAHMFYNTIATILIFMSFTSLPVIIKDVQTFDGKVVLDIDINEATESKILNVYVYDGTTKKSVHGPSSTDLIDFEINNLEVGTTYEIIVEYQYTSMPDTVYEETITETKSTTAVAIGK